jgi:antitoxin CcdA
MASKRLRESGPARRATNISLPAVLVDDAKRLGINVSRSCEDGLAKAVKAQREAEWLAENREALLSNHAWIEKNGIPLAQFRKF